MVVGNGYQSLVDIHLDLVKLQACWRRHRNRIYYLEYVHLMVCLAAKGFFAHRRWLSAQIPFLPHTSSNMYAFSHQCTPNSERPSSKNSQLSSPRHATPDKTVVGAEPYLCISRRRRFYASGTPDYRQELYGSSFADINKILFG